MGRDIFHQPGLLRAPSNLALNTAREGAATASLGNLCWCFITLMVKNFLQISALLVYSHSPLPYHYTPSWKAPLHPSWRPLQALAAALRSPPEPSLLQAEQPQLPQPVLIAEVLQPSDHLHGSPLDPLHMMGFFHVVVEKIAKQGPFLITCYLDFKRTVLLKNGFPAAGITCTVLHLHHRYLPVNH